MVKIEKSYMLTICIFHFLIVKMYQWDRATDVTFHITHFIGFVILHM